MAKTGRNAPCPCGSGKKYKKCCMKKDQAAAGPPKIMTASGEEASFHQARYDLFDREQALARFDQAPDFDLDEPGAGKTGETSISWLETGESARLMQSIQSGKPLSNPFFPGMGEDGPQRLLGDVKISDNKMLFNSMGQQRFELGKKRLESLLEGLVRHRLDSIQSMASAMAGQSRPGMGGVTLPGQRPGLDTNLNDPKYAQLEPGETIQDALRSREFNSLEEANAFLQIAGGQYNNTPQAELGGLSPGQIAAVLRFEWDDPEGPMVLNRNLKIEDLADTSPIMGLAHFFILSCDRLGGIKATKAGYLNTGYVLTMAANILFDDEEMREAFITEKQGRFKERDLFPLFLVRILCQFGGLLELKQNRFHLTKDGKEMLDHGNAGRFFTRLFLAQFQGMDLDAMAGTGQSFPSIQDTLAFSLYKLSQMDSKRWYNPSEFYPTILLPVVKREVGGSEYVSEWTEDDWRRVIEALDRRLINLLGEFGLIEEREVEQAGTEVETFQLRPTPLLRKFISFNF